MRIIHIQVDDSTDCYRPIYMIQALSCPHAAVKTNRLGNNIGNLSFYIFCIARAPSVTALLVFSRTKWDLFLHHKRMWGGGQQNTVSTRDLQRIRRMAQRTRTRPLCQECKSAKAKCSDYRPCSRCKRIMQGDCKPQADESDTNVRVAIRGRVNRCKISNSTN